MHERSLIQKLDEFIRKYYKNELIRGSIYFAGFSLLAFLFIALAEYFGHYSTLGRALLFNAFLGFTAFCLVKYLAIPLARLYSFGQRISYKQASQVIGAHFPEVKDKLLNTLQLQERNEMHGDALLEAAIRQKTEELRPVPFASAINFRQNIKYLRYAALPVAVYAAILIISPGMISDSGQRLVHYNKVFKIPAPFEFNVLNKSLETEQFSDFTLKLELSGDKLPAEVYVEHDGNAFKMNKTDRNSFEYIFRNIQKDIPFHFRAGDFNSDAYKLSVLAKPVMLQYQLSCTYPPYVHKKNEILNNPGDITVPAGTVLKWNFLTRQTEEVLLGFGEQEFKAEQEDASHFTYMRKVFLSDAYYILNRNRFVQHADSMRFALNVVPDAKPSIQVEEKYDSVNSRQVLCVGELADDYGLSKLTFQYRYVSSEDQNKKEAGAKIRALPIDRSANPQHFYYIVNLDELGVQASDELEYFFEVWDNDGVHGPKSTRSKLLVYKAPSVKELEKEASENSNALKEKMKEALRENREVQKAMKELEMKMLEKKELTWEEKRKAENLLDRQKELSKKIEELQKNFKQNNEKEQQFKEEEMRIMEKEQQLQKMYEEIMTDEMKDVMKKLENLLHQQNKDMIKNELDKMQLNNKDVEKELDRMLEMYKQLEVEKKLDESVKKLDELTQKQEELSKKTEDKKMPGEALKKEQDKLNEEFKELQKQFKDIEQQNSKLENPKDIANTEQEEKNADSEMNSSSEELSKGGNKNAAQAQKKAASELKQISEKKKKSIEEAEGKEIEEDVDALREILENLVQLSKDQEDLMDRFQTVNGYNPQFVKMAQEQKIIKDNAQLVEDSMLALSKRVPEIRSYVNREVSKMNDHLEKSIKSFSIRDIPSVRTQQQYAMTRMNNLAVMLSNILKQMQQQMSAQQKEKDSKNAGQKMCKGKNPGKGKSGQGSRPSMGELRKMQDELNKQLREGMNKNGTGQQQGNMGTEQYARMAAQQMAIRQQLQKMMQEMDAREKEQLGGSKMLGEMQKMMEETEKDLVYKKLSAESLKRQEEILTRLLESEKAERKQEQDIKREAEQAKEKEHAVPPSFEKYIRQKNNETELLKTVPAELQPYYRQKAEEYLNTIGK